MKRADAACLLLLLACSEAPRADTPPSKATCGDGVRSELEACELNDLAGADCIDAGFEGGALSCTVACAFDTSACTGSGPLCGDSLLAGIEQCDREAFGGASCASLGFAAGLLACNSACTYDLSSCSNPPGPNCGDGALDPGEACDGAAPPGETCTDHGFAAGLLGCDAACSVDTSQCSTTEPYPGSNLDTAVGCEGVYNADQLLTLHLELPDADWNAILADTSGSLYFAAAFRCEDGPPIVVGVRRKRSGGQQKPGLKIDFNKFVPDQTFFDLRKLSLEVGVSSGGTAESDKKDIITEYLANRLMYLSGAIASRAAFVQLIVNGSSIGVYANVEDVGKRFLRDRIGDDSGWLYKKSGGDDGYNTNETTPNPYEDYFCFWQNRCEPPSADVLLATLPAKLDIQQLLRIGAVNALIGNTDSPLFKNNNYLFYDYAGGPRLYFAWDLDTVMGQSFDVFVGSAGGNSNGFDAALFTHWEDEYEQVLTDVVELRLPLSVIEAELDRALTVGAPALDVDPFAGGESTSAATEDVREWWQARHPQVAAQIAAH